MNDPKVIDEYFDRLIHIFTFIVARIEFELPLIHDLILILKLFHLLDLY